jgi:hypothetical protein
MADFGVTSVQASSFIIKAIGRTYTKHNYRKYVSAFNTPFPFSVRVPIKDVVGVLIMISTVEERRRVHQRGYGVFTCWKK